MDTGWSNNRVPVWVSFNLMLLNYLILLFVTGFIVVVVIGFEDVMSTCPADVIVTCSVNFISTFPADSMIIGFVDACASFCGVKRVGLHFRIIHKKTSAQKPAVQAATRIFGRILMSLGGIVRNSVLVSRPVIRKAK